ncbi:hypothetical protein ACYTFC_17190 [Streptomyces globosus]
MMQFGKVVGMTLGALAIAGSAPAAAIDIQSNRDGAVRAYSYGTNTRVAVADTKQDGHPVYANYRRNTDGQYTLWNKSGSGTTTTSGAGATIYIIQACVSIDAWPDSCDSWRE